VIIRRITLKIREISLTNFSLMHLCYKKRRLQKSHTLFISIFSVTRPAFAWVELYMIEISKDALVYLVCPPAYASGGPELIYQLASKLADHGVETYLYYHPRHEDPVHPNYVGYGTRSADFIEDDKRNLLIVPEALVPSFNEAETFNHIRKCIWWLSVDNFFADLYRRAPARRIARIPLIRALRIYEKRYFAEQVRTPHYEYHLAQSQYAMALLKAENIDGSYLSDFLGPHFFERARELQAIKKQDIVLYNPAKGGRFTAKIMEAAADLTWIPIQNMTPAEVADLLARAKVYIDFGHHPGKDRFPREAALLNCCIITGKRGSAAYDEDVNIPGKYKINDSKFNIARITRLIRSCIQDYDRHTKDFDHYRDLIRKEEQQFIKDMKTVFLKTENK